MCIILSTRLNEKVVVESIQIYSFVAVFHLCSAMAQCAAASSIGRTQVIAPPRVLNDKAFLVLALAPLFVHRGTLMRNSS